MPWLTVFVRIIIHKWQNSTSPNQDEPAAGIPARQETWWRLVDEPIHSTRHFRKAELRQLYKTIDLAG